VVSGGRRDTAPCPVGQGSPDRGQQEDPDLVVVDSGTVTRIYNTSTGSNKGYLCAGSWRIALTASGRFAVFRTVNGWDNGLLGNLYRPQYFNRGAAVHGDTSVPSTPASRGCCRVSLPAMDNLWDGRRLRLGTPVLVY
jgi:N-acetylmuramoyl-L-alanine amidase